MQQMTEYFNMEEEEDDEEEENEDLETLQRLNKLVTCIDGLSAKLMELEKQRYTERLVQSYTRDVGIIKESLQENVYAIKAEKYLSHRTKEDLQVNQDMIRQTSLTEKREEQKGDKGKSGKDLFKQTIENDMHFLDDKYSIVKLIAKEMWEKRTLSMDPTFADGEVQSNRDTSIESKGKEEQEEKEEKKEKELKEQKEEEKQDNISTKSDEQFMKEEERENSILRESKVQETKAVHPIIRTATEDTNKLDVKESETIVQPDENDIGLNTDTRERDRKREKEEQESDFKGKSKADTAHFVLIEREYETASPKNCVPQEQEEKDDSFQLQEELKRKEKAHKKEMKRLQQEKEREIAECQQAAMTVANRLVEESASLQEIQKKKVQEILQHVHEAEKLETLKSTLEKEYESVYTEHVRKAAEQVQEMHRRLKQEQLRDASAQTRVTEKREMGTHAEDRVDKAVGSQPSETVESTQTEAKEVQSTGMQAEEEVEENPVGCDAVVQTEKKQVTERCVQVVQMKEEKTETETNIDRHTNMETQNKTTQINVQQTMDAQVEVKETVEKGVQYSTESSDKGKAMETQTERQIETQRETQTETQIDTQIKEQVACNDTGTQCKIEMKMSEVWVQTEVEKVVAMVGGEDPTVSVDVGVQYENYEQSVATVSVGEDREQYGTGIYARKEEQWENDTEGRDNHKKLKWKSVENRQGMLREQKELKCATNTSLAEEEEEENTPKRVRTEGIQVQETNSDNVSILPSFSPSRSPFVPAATIRASKEKENITQVDSESELYDSFASTVIKSETEIDKHLKTNWNMELSIEGESMDSFLSSDLCSSAEEEEEGEEEEEEEQKEEEKEGQILSKTNDRSNSPLHSLVQKDDVGEFYSTTITLPLAGSFMETDEEKHEKKTEKETDTFRDQVNDQNIVIDGGDLECISKENENELQKTSKELVITKKEEEEEKEAEKIERMDEKETEDEETNQKEEKQTEEQKEEKLEKTKKKQEQEKETEKEEREEKTEFLSVVPHAESRHKENEADLCFSVDSLQASKTKSNFIDCTEREKEAAPTTLTSEKTHFSETQIPSSLYDHHDIVPSAEISTVTDRSVFTEESDEHVSSRASASACAGLTLTLTPKEEQVVDEVLEQLVSEQFSFQEAAITLRNKEGEGRRSEGKDNLTSTDERIRMSQQENLLQTGLPKGITLSVHEANTVSYVLESLITETVVQYHSLR